MKKLTHILAVMLILFTPHAAMSSDLKIESNNDGVILMKNAYHDGLEMMFCGEYDIVEPTKDGDRCASSMPSLLSEKKTFKGLTAQEVVDNLSKGVPAKVVGISVSSFGPAQSERYIIYYKKLN